VVNMALTKYDIRSEDKGSVTRQRDSSLLRFTASILIWDSHAPIKLDKVIRVGCNSP